MVGAVNMAVGLYYYARVIAEMYMRGPVYDYPLLGRRGLTLTYGLSSPAPCCWASSPAPCWIYAGAR